MESNEQTQFSNQFGVVTSKRITLRYKTGNEDIALNQISSISLQHKRNTVLAYLGFGICALLLLFMINTIHRLGGAEVLIMMLFAILALLAGLANWYGNHDIVISASGTNRKPLKVEFSKTKEGREFVNAVKKAVFK